MGVGGDSQTVHGYCRGVWQGNWGRGGGGGGVVITPCRGGVGGGESGGGGGGCVFKPNAERAN
eukprot:CAMPEP_0173194620 /NCGR_PEP_ID=MMETSP1141-20130122/14605_1 /TAXON_ID=483371 /ORGANISM="non described non described, Strain CCMP2298" /LENGTH=62 /DNA_ID=CAMNT_0014119067 /DNA_START=886 /DNA_END=1074 /DNA_ORIENTATION=-